MLDVKTNYRNRYADTNCPNCKAADDDQEHLLNCSELSDGRQLIDDCIQYENIFSSNLENILKVSRIIEVNFKKRKELIKSSEMAQVNRS